MTMENANAHEQLVALMHATLARFLPEKLVAKTGEPRQFHNTPERYLAMKIPKKFLGIFPGHEEEKVFAAYPWETSVGCVVCYLFLDRNGLLEEVKRVIRAFHAEAKVDVVLSFEIRGREPISYAYPLKPISLPPPIR